MLTYLFKQEPKPEQPIAMNLLVAPEWEDLSWGQAQPLEPYEPTPASTRVQPLFPTQPTRSRIPSRPSLPKPPSRSRTWGLPPNLMHTYAQQPVTVHTPVRSARAAQPTESIPRYAQQTELARTPAALKAQVVQRFRRPPWGTSLAHMLPPPGPSSQRGHHSSSRPSSDRTPDSAQTPRAVRRMEIEKGVENFEAGSSRLRPSSPSSAIEVAALTQRPRVVRPGQGVKGSIAPARGHWGRMGRKF